MKSGIEIFISFISLTIMSVLLINIIAADINTMNARDLQASYVTEIEDSNLSTTVIQSCIDDAEKNGYKLKVTPMQIGEENGAQIVLTYTYNIPILGVLSEHEIVGCAK